MSIWHVILSIAFVAVAILIALALPRMRGNRRKEAGKDRLNQGMTFNEPQQEATTRPNEDPKAPYRGEKARR